MMAPLAPVGGRQRAREDSRGRAQGLQGLLRRWGASPIEFVFALPVLLFVLLGAMQAGGLTAVHKHMQRVADGVAADIAAGSLAPKRAEAVAHARLAGWGLDYRVKVSVVSDTSGGTPKREVSVAIELPTRGFGATDVLGLYRGRVLGAVAVETVP